MLPKVSLSPLKDIFNVTFQCLLQICSQINASEGPQQSLLRTANNKSRLPRRRQLCPHLPVSSFFFCGRARRHAICWVCFKRKGNAVIANTSACFPPRAQAALIYYHSSSSAQRPLEAGRAAESSQQGVPQHMKQGRDRVRYFAVTFVLMCGTHRFFHTSSTEFIETRCIAANVQMLK